MKNPKPTSQDKEKYLAAKRDVPEVGHGQRLHFRFDRTLTGEQLAAALKETVIQHSIDPKDVYVRFFSSNRLGQVLATGSDRDMQANIAYHGSTDGEQEWMRALGIWSNADVTFVSPLGNRLTGGADAPKSHDMCYVMYDKRFLHKVNPYASNGFHAFLVHSSRACIGIMSDRGEIELARVARAEVSSEAGVKPPETDVSPH